MFVIRFQGDVTIVTLEYLFTHFNSRLIYISILDFGKETAIAFQLHVPYLALWYKQLDITNIGIIDYMYLNDLRYGRVLNYILLRIT